MRTIYKISTLSGRRFSLARLKEGKKKRSRCVQLKNVNVKKPRCCCCCVILRLLLYLCQFESRLVAFSRCSQAQQLENTGCRSQDPTVEMFRAFLLGAK